MKVKFNNGNPVILCENCSKILKKYKGENIKDGNIDNLLYFCSDKCSEEYIEKLKRKIVIINK